MRNGWPMRSPKGGADWETVRVRNVATRRGSRRRGRVGALLGAVVDARLEGLLLLAISGAAEAQGARSGALGPGRLLPPPRHAAVGRSADLSAAGSPVVDRQRDGQRRRPLRVSDARIAAPTTTTSCTSSTSEYAAHAEHVGDRSSRLSKRSTPNSRRSATTSRASTCAATRTRRIAACIAIDLENPDPASWKVVVAEQPHPIEHAALIGGRVVVHHLVDVQSRLQVFGLDGSRRRRDRAAGRRLDRRHLRPHRSRTRSGTSSARRCSPATVYRYDLDTRGRIAFEPPSPPIDPDAV